MKATLPHARPRSGSSRGPFRSVLSSLAVGLVVVALGFFGLVFVVRGDIAQAQVYTGGFLLAFVAAVVWGVDVVRNRGEHVTLLPTTTLGWFVVGLMAASALVQFVGTGLQFVAAVYSYGPLFGFMLALAAAVVGVVATIRRERSAIVLVLTAFPAAFLLYFFIGELLFPH